MSHSQRPVWLGEDHRGWDHVRVHVQLLNDPRVGSYELAVYVGVVAHAELSTGRAFPAAATLARYAVCSERKVRDCLALLSTLGYIAVEHRDGRASVFTVLAPPPLHDVPGSDDGTLEGESGDPCTSFRATPARRSDEREPLNESQQPSEDSGQRAALPALREDRSRWCDVKLDDGRFVRLSWNVPIVVAASEHIASAVELCEEFARSLEDREPGASAKATSKGWVCDMEALLRIDGREATAVRWVIGWLRAGEDDIASFWRTNIRSPNKLRSKWGQMAEQYARQRKTQTKDRRPLSDEGRVALARQYAANGADPRPSSGSGLPSGHAGGPP